MQFFFFTFLTAGASASRDFDIVLLILTSFATFDCGRASIQELNATFLFIGKDVMADENAVDLRPFVRSGNIAVTPMTDWNNVLKHIGSARAIMTPNVHDASPRVLLTNPFLVWYSKPCHRRATIA